MKGVYTGVQKQLLNINSRAFFTPFSCHNYNLFVADVVKTCPDALTFFRIVQRIYSIFSASTKKRSLFRKHVSNLSVKPLCETSWECRIDSVKALRYQLPEICDILNELVKEAKEVMIKSKAETLYETLKQYKFLVSLVLRHHLLFQVEFVIKELQSEIIDLSTAMDSFNNYNDLAKETQS